MTGLSQEQQEMQAAIRKKAMIWGIVLGLIVTGILWWILGSQGTPVRAGAAVIGGVAVGFATLKKSMTSNAASATCAKCNAAFSISRSDRSENVVSSEPREEREAQEDGSTKVTTWVEEKVDVTETFTCASCNDITTKEYQTTRKRDEEERIEPKPEPKKVGKSDKGADRPPKNSDSASKGGAKKK